MQCSCGSVWPSGKCVDDVTEGRAGLRAAAKNIGRGWQPFIRSGPRLASWVSRPHYGGTPGVG